MASVADEQEQAHSNWIDDIKQAKRNCREFLFHVESAGFNPDMMVLPGGDSLFVNGRYQPIRDFHSAVLDYHDQLVINGVQKSVQELWGEDLYTPRKFDLEPISLSNLSKWRMKHVTVTESTEDPVGGESVQRSSYRVWIPPKAAARCYSQLNNVVDEVDLAIELPERSIDLSKHDPL